MTGCLRLSSKWSGVRVDRGKWNSILDLVTSILEFLIHFPPPYMCLKKVKYFLLENPPGLPIWVDAEVLPTGGQKVTKPTLNLLPFHSAPLLFAYLLAFSVLSLVSPLGLCAVSAQNTFPQMTIESRTLTFFKPLLRCCHPNKGPFKAPSAQLQPSTLDAQNIIFWHIILFTYLNEYKLHI